MENDYLEKERLFWEVEYPKKTFEEKTIYWANKMFQHARWQNEWGLGTYDIYTPEWYQSILNDEPDFDRILQFIFEHYESEFYYQEISSKEILRRIGKDEWELKGK